MVTYIFLNILSLTTRQTLCGNRLLTQFHCHKRNVIKYMKNNNFKFKLYCFIICYLLSYGFLYNHTRYLYTIKKLDKYLIVLKLLQLLNSCCLCICIFFSFNNKNCITLRKKYILDLIMVLL